MTVRSRDPRHPRVNGRRRREAPAPAGRSTGRGSAPDGRPSRFRAPPPAGPRGAAGSCRRPARCAPGRARRLVRRRHPHRPAPRTGAPAQHHPRRLTRCVRLLERPGEELTGQVVPALRQGDPERALRPPVELRRAAGAGPGAACAALVVHVEQAVGHQPVEVEGRRAARHAERRRGLVPAHRTRLPDDVVVEPAAGRLGQCRDRGDVVLHVRILRPTTIGGRFSARGAGGPPPGPQSIYAGSAITRATRPRARPARPAATPLAEGEMDVVLALVVVVVLGLLVLVGASVRVVTQYQRGVVLRFGQLLGDARPPGLTLIAPGIDRMHKVNMQIVTMPVPAQEGITRDNVTVKVDAVVYWRVVDPVRVVVDVQNYQSAIGQVAQASLRSIIGKSELDDLLSNRERLNQGLELMMDSPAVDWGIHIDRVDIKDVALPESMKRSIARQAEAGGERRSRVITAEGELQASEKLAEAARVMTAQPAALQLRLLQTMVEVAAAKNSTVVLPFPVELLRFLERSTPAAAEDAA